MNQETAIKLLELAPDALIMVNSAGTIVYANSAVGTLFGYSRPELIGHGIEELIPERFGALHARHRAVFGAAPSTREMGSRVTPLVAKRRDGTEFRAEIRLAPIQLADGLHVAVAVRDSTERHKLNEELVAARKEADKANQAKSRFLATASHDLRQPLQTLQLLHAVLIRKTETAAISGLLSLQEQALATMADLLNSLLDISKLESGTVKPNIEEVSLDDVCADLRRQFETVTAQRGLTLVVEPSDACLRTDRVLLRELLQNLLANAVRYTDSGGVTLRSARSDSGLSIEVADTGVGIPPEKLDRIFDEYYQIDHAAAGRKGFGLGLTIVKGITRLLGYAIHVESTPGTGTRFRVDIPAAALVDAADRAAVRKLPPRDVAAATKPGILVIEDDDAVRSAIELALSLEGYPTRTAASGEAAEAVFEREGHIVDIVISDFHLNGPRNGLQIVQSLRDAAGRDLPAVFLSGDTSSITRIVDELPRSRLLSKPADFDRLVRTLEELFGESEPPAEPRGTA